MMVDLAIFFLLFAIQLIAFSCVGILTFGSIEEYGTLSGTVIMFTESALGNWNFGIYDVMGDKKYIGIIFHTILICVNMLLLLNLVIAIMADTWATLSEVKLGLYLKGIVEAIPAYQNDKRYGGLISLPPPFNIFALVLLPFYHCFLDKDRLQRFNSTVCKTFFLPIAIFFTLGFLAGALIMTPFAWFKILKHSFGSICSSETKNGFCRMIFYFLFGLPWLLLVAIIDSYWFLVHQYHQEHTKTLEGLKYPKISL